MSLGSEMTATEKMALVNILRLFFLLIVTCTFSASGKKYKDGKETWGYVEIRPDANMFWWLYYSNSNSSYQEQPLIMWLQGGPGASSTGYGNFMEIGPLTVDLQPRNTTWIQQANVLFVDSPVGTGFSYVTNKSALATNNSQIANDLVTFVAAFFKKIPEFQKIPFYIFSESYGGKMAISFALALQKALEAGKIACTFKGVAMGDSWISPVDIVLSWGPYLYSTSMIDEVGLKAINDATNAVQAAFNSGNYEKATELFNDAEAVIEKFTNNVNFYNILNKSSVLAKTVTKTFSKKYVGDLYRRHLLVYEAPPLDKLMNGVVKMKLRVIPENVTWGGQSADVFDALTKDFMIPVTDEVELALNTTRLSIVVYNGQLDLIVDTLGTVSWIQNLKWPGLQSFNQSTRSPISIPDDDTAAFVKSYKNFALYWILKSGHMVPLDAGVTSLKLLTLVTKDGNKP